MIEVTDRLHFLRHGEQCPELHQTVMAQHPDLSVVGTDDGL